MKTRSKLYKFFTATAWIALLACLVAVGTLGAKIYSKNAAKKTPKSSYKAEEAAEVAKPEVVPAVANEEIDVDAINASFKDVKIPEEDKALLENGLVLPQLDPADAESKLDEFTLGPVSEELLRPVRDWLGWEIDYSSYPVDLVTGDEMTKTRIYSAKELGYVTEGNSFATMPGFPKDWKAYAKEHDLPDDITEEEVVYYWIGKSTANYQFFLGMVDIFGEAKTLGTKNKDITGNEFFGEILKLAAEAEMENKGITKFVDQSANPPLSRYSLDWQNYRAKFMLWLGQCTFGGRQNWWTRERSYLGPADGTAHDGVEYKFDYTNVAYIRPNFTTAKQRQTDLSSYVFCFRDKQNGYRISDFFGINCTDGDAELYTEGTPIKKKDVTAGGGYNPAKQPDGTVKVATTSSKVEVKKPEPTPTPTPTTTPKKKYNKKKEASSVLKPENQIDGKNPVGQGTDAFQSVKPAEPASTVAEAQHQPTEQTKAIIDNGGNKTTPGQPGPSLPNPGQTITNPDDGSKSDFRETPGGVTVEDRTNEKGDEKTENAQAETPPIPEQPDPDHDGTSQDNTGMPSGFGF